MSRSFATLRVPSGLVMRIGYAADLVMSNNRQTS